MQTAEQTTNEKSDLRSHEKAKKLLLKISEAILVIAILGFLVLFGVGLAAWLDDIQNYGILIISLIIFFLPIVLFLILIYEIEKKLQKYEPRFRLTKESAKQITVGALPTIGLLIIAYLLNYYTNLFPVSVSDNIALEIFKVLIQTNGFLIGFVGIVCAQLLWAIHNQQGDLQKNLLEQPFKPDEKNSFDIREKYLIAYEKKRSSIIRLMFAVVAFLIASILLSLSGLAQIDLVEPIKTNPQIIAPFFAMTNGILLFVVSIAESKMDIRKDVLKILVSDTNKINSNINRLKKEIHKKEIETKKITEEIDKLKNIEKNKNVPQS